VKRSHLSVIGLAAATFLWGCAHPSSTAEPGNQAQQLKTELKQMEARFQEEKYRDGNTLARDLSKLEITERNIPETTYLLSRLVTIQSESKKGSAKKSGGKKKVPHLVPEVDLLGPNPTEAEKFQLLRMRWRARDTAVADYIFELAHEGFGSAKDVLRFLVHTKDLIPYFDVFVSQAGYEIDKLQIPIVYKPAKLSEDVKKQIRSLLQDDRLITWANSRKTNLQQYAGTTNTVIGLYDWIAYPEYREKTGFQDFPQQAEAYYDLGGGFATPDISRVIGKEFISLDLISPKNAKDWALNFQVLKKWRLPKMGIAETRLQDETEHAKYLDQLDSQKWLYLDVYENPLPSNFKSYFITSFGFLSSTVMSLSESNLNDKSDQTIAYYGTTYMAVRRIVELIAQGKDVTLFTYQRAYPLKYKYRTVYLSFKDHHLTLYKLWPNGPETNASGIILRPGPSE
jgi:hypothetical protein